MLGDDLDAARHSGWFDEEASCAGHQAQEAFLWQAQTLIHRIGPYPVILYPAFHAGRFAEIGDEIQG